MSEVNVLQQLLGQLEITYEDLNEEEKKTFNGWRDALTGKSITDEDVKMFLDSEMASAVEKSTNPEYTHQVREFYRMELRLISKIKDFLAGPDKQKRMVEHQIRTQLN
jgi:hypothetical protein